MIVQINFLVPHSEDHVFLLCSHLGWFVPHACLWVQHVLLLFSIVCVFIHHTGFIQEMDVSAHVKYYYNLYLMVTLCNYIVSTYYFDMDCINMMVGATPRSFCTWFPGVPSGSQGWLQGEILVPHSMFQRISPQINLIFTTYVIKYPVATILGGWCHTHVLQYLVATGGCGEKCWCHITSSKVYSLKSLGFSPQM